MITGSATGRVIANFALLHLKAAIKFRDSVIAIESEHGQEPLGAFFEDICSFGSACIMSSAAALEALINELYVNPAGMLRPLLSDFDSNFWGKGGLERKGILLKYQRALDLLGIPRMDEKAPIFRDAWALIELRNALVHFKPTWDPDRKMEVELKTLLGGQFSTSPFVDTGADFVAVQCMSSGCAKWVLTTTFALLHEFHSKTNVEPNKMAQFWSLEK